MPVRLSKGLLARVDQEYSVGHGFVCIEQDEEGATSIDEGRGG